MSKFGEAVVIVAALVGIAVGGLYLNDHVTFVNFFGTKAAIVH